MPYEVGGRADKLGNRYEARWVVKQMLRVINEEINSIILEAVGDEEEGVDVLIINKNGAREYHQCKGRNASKEKWTIADLNNKNILRNAKKHLDRNYDSTFVLISPIPCIMLHDIHERAVNSNGCSEDFYLYQIKKSSKDLSDFFDDYCRYMNLKTSKKDDMNKAIDYLSRTDFHIVADDRNEKRIILDQIAFHFVGKPEVIYSLLNNYILERDLLGRVVTSSMIIKYLQENGVELRNLALDNRIFPRIQELNIEFRESLNLINGSFIKRKEVDEILCKIENGNSVVIHGKAGYGKSGCIIEILNRIKSQNIGILALRMDKRTPEGSAECYGESLDLPSSPIYCINELYKHEKAVIIFDQLDAIRWTNTNSNTYIEVCNEMIRQVKQINKDRDRDKQISIIFVCRTYDYENDQSIKSLFRKDDETSYVQGMVWKEVKINELADSDVEGIVGGLYSGFSKRMRSILKVPNNLYIWTHLDDERKLNEISSSNELIELWIEQLIKKFEDIGYRAINIKEIILEIVSLIEKYGKLELNKRLIKNCSPNAIKYLNSEGLINDSNGKISFVHQSFFDYFLVNEMFEKVIDTEEIIEVIGNKRKQTPMKRYQIQMLLQIIQEDDFDLFVKLGYQILDSNEIRFFMKYLYIELLSQSSIMSKSLEGLLNKYVNNEKYKSDFIDTVFMNHEVFILCLIKNNTISLWLDGNIDEIKLAVSLLKSVNTKIQDDIAKLISRCILKDSEIDTILYGCLCDNIVYDSESMFSIRMKLIQDNPKFLERSIIFDELFKYKPNRALLILKEIVNYSHGNHRYDIYTGIDDIFYNIDEIDTVDGKLICEILLPIIPQESNYYSSKLYGWTVVYNNIKTPERACIYLLKKGMKDIIEKDVDVFLQILDKYKSSDSILINEILLESSLLLPIEYANDIIYWICENNGMHFFNKSGENKDELYHTKQIIIKFSKYCSEDAFKKLEKIIYEYQEKDRSEILRNRIKTNSQRNGYHVYWHYWGEVQYSLLPCFFYEALSLNSRNLIKVLKRRFNNVYLKHQKSESYGGSVTSKISPNANLFSDKTWRKIIINKDIEKKENTKWIRSKNVFYETSMEQFAVTFGRVAEYNPSRFAKLLLTLPNNIDIYYINEIFRLIGIKEWQNTSKDKSDWIPISLELAEALINKFKHRLNDRNCAKTLCKSIINRSNESWSNNILEIISKLAILDQTYVNNDIISDEDLNEAKTFEILWTKSINCVNGSAAEAIGSILSYRKELIDIFMPTIELLVKDKRPEVRLASISCLYSMYYIDKPRAEKLIVTLFNSDFRIASHPISKQLVYLMYTKYDAILDNIIEKMFCSGEKYVCEAGANIVANIYMQYGKLDKLIFSIDKLNENQKRSIVLVAISLFNRESYTEKCKKILELFLDEDNEIGYLYNSLFFEKKIYIARDKELLIKMLKSNISSKIINYFIEYLEDYDESVIDYSEIVFELCRSIIAKSKEGSNALQYNLYGIEVSISNLIMSLYEKSIGIDEINEECLDILDLMFENSIGRLRKKLSDSIKDY